MELHPSRTARSGNIETNAVTKGRHADKGPFPAAQEVWCSQCGFPCNLARDAKNVDEFSGQSITSGNELTNGSFENWTGGNPDDWSVSGSVTQETTAGYYDWRDDGASSVKIVRDGSDISLSQTLSTPSDFNSNIVRFGARVKSVIIDVVRLRIVLNGTTYTSVYNIAQQRFQELSLQIQAPATVSSLVVSILADSQDGTAYVDAASLSRSGNPSSSSVGSGCPMCSSYNYFNRPTPLSDNESNRC